MQTKICKVCGQKLSTDEFYTSKNICIYCYKRKARLNRRIAEGKPIKTVKELINELVSLPQDAKVLLFDDIGVYRPVSIEFAKNILNDKEYSNAIIIS